MPDGTTMEIRKDGDIEKKMQAIMEICRAVAQETDLDRLLNQILDTAMEITDCRAGTLYFREGEYLSFKVVRNLDMKELEEDCDSMPPIPITSRKHLCSLAAVERKHLSISDAYHCQDYDLSGPMEYDALTGYHTQSVLVYPIFGSNGDCLSVLQLINATDEQGICDFTNTISFVDTLSNVTSSALQQVHFQTAIEKLTRQRPEMENADPQIAEDLAKHINDNYYGLSTKQELYQAEKDGIIDRETREAKEKRMLEDVARRANREHAMVDYDDLEKNVDAYVKDKIKMNQKNKKIHQVPKENELLSKCVYAYMDACERAGRKVTMNQIAEMADINKGTLSALCSGSRRLNKQYILKIALALNFSLECTNELLEACGESLDGTSERDMAVEFFLEQNKNATHPLHMSDIEGLLGKYDSSDSQRKKDKKQSRQDEDRQK